jgi:uncharacterized membrane protein YhaH (DUF805 family)
MAPGRGRRGLIAPWGWKEDRVFGWVVHCVENFVVFRGRAGRPEYWFFALFVGVVSVLLRMLGLFFPQAFIVSGIWSLVILLPHYAVATRRLHDSGHTGWWLVPPVLVAVPLAIAGTGQLRGLRRDGGHPGLWFLALLALLAFGIWIFSLMVRRGDAGPNRYGDPAPTTPSQARH